MISKVDSKELNLKAITFSNMELHLNTFGSFIKKKDDMFEVIIDEKKVKLAPDKISSIVISNAVTITSDAIQLAMESNIDIVFLDKYGDPYGRVWFPKIGSTVLIRRKQLEMLQDDVGLLFTKQRIVLKMMNQYGFIQKLVSKRECDKEMFAKIQDKIRGYAKNVYYAHGTLDDLSSSFMGWEGNVSRLYFGVLAKLIPSSYSFNGRSSRPAKDAFNAFLNYGYGILYSKVERAIIIAGLDPYIGLLHSDNYNKMSFVYDFIEPYRTLVDEPVFYLFSRHKFQDQFLENVHSGVVLSTEGKKFFAPTLLEYFDTIIRYHNKNRKQIEMIQTDAHAFANYLINKRRDYLDSGIAKKLQNFIGDDAISEEE